MSTRIQEKKIVERSSGQQAHKTTTTTARCFPFGFFAANTNEIEALFSEMVIKRPSRARESDQARRDERPTPPEWPPLPPWDDEPPWPPLPPWD